ncbi:MAG: gamma-glutamyltransferase [Candidatus Methylomirabilales bacterium]
MPHERASRPTVLAPRALVTSPHYLASEAGVAILREGGNAIEAAIATATVLCVVYPHMTSLGGDNFWLIYDAGRRNLLGLNASGRAGGRCTVEFYRERGYTDAIPPRGVLSALTVPGGADGWWEAYRYSRRHLKGRIPWAVLFRDAIRYAKEGFPVTEVQEEATAANLETEDREVRYLQRFEGFRRLFLNRDRPRRSGKLMVQRDLAKTLEQVAREGRDAFYRGAIAKRIARYLKEHDGLLTREDFEGHRSDWVMPLGVSYRGHRVYSLPPNSQGIAFLMLMGVLDHFRVDALGEGSAAYLHLIVETTKRVFQDRNRWVTDPLFVRPPLRRLLSRSYLKEIADGIAQGEERDGSAERQSDGDTVWLGVVDKAGNAVSLIQSIYFEFGAGIVAGDTGVLLQNRGSAFSLDSAHPNVLAPRKRTFHTLMPAMILRQGRLSVVLGTMGGEGQPQTLTAIATRIIDFGMTAQEAIEAPRWLFGRTWALPEQALYLEGRFRRAVLQALAAKEHRVRILPEWSERVGQAQVIVIDPDSKIRHGGADPRGDGLALGF